MKKKNVAILVCIMVLITLIAMCVAFVYGSILKFKEDTQKQETSKSTNQNVNIIDNQNESINNNTIAKNENTTKNNTVSNNTSISNNTVSKNTTVNNITSSNTKNEAKTYLDMYKNYLKDNIFKTSKDIDVSKVVGGLFKVNNISNPIFLVKYQAKDNSFYIRALHIKGDEVLASSDYKATSISCGYNLNDKEIVYFIKDISYGLKYKSVTDIVNEKSDITSLEEKAFGNAFRLFNEEIEFYTIENTKIDEGLKNLEEKYKSQDMTSINNQIAEIESNRLYMDENGIYNKKYRIPFGKYVYNNESNITLKSDNSAERVRLRDYHEYGSFYLENDKIISKAYPGEEFKIIDNTKIQRISDNTIWRLEN